MLMTRSPKGGRRMTTLTRWLPVGKRRQTLSPLREKDEEEHHLTVYHIGYCGGCAKPIYVRPSVAAYLLSMFRR